MVVEPPAQRLDQPGPLGRHPAAGQIGEPPWITLTGANTIQCGV